MSMNFTPIYSTVFYDRRKFFTLVNPVFLQTIYPIPKDISHFYGKFVENIGVEPMTSCVQGRRSSQLS